MEKMRMEYIWIDGQKPTAKMRSKTKIISVPSKNIKLSDIHEWGFDGSSTEQAETSASDCTLKPVFFVSDPIHGKPHILVLCEVFWPDGTPHPSNTRYHLRAAAKKFKNLEPWFGIEQEYTMYTADNDRPLRWPKGAGYPAPQGRYYCGVGTDEVYGRDLVEVHTEACLQAGIAIHGTNGEVMPAQWEFQIGTLEPLAAADHLWMARWLLYRTGEDLRIAAKLDPKPISKDGGDWNGAGAHTNFSTNEMRKTGGMGAIEAACEKLGKFHQEHVASHIYGEDNDKRLTGRHETCDINTYKYGIADRGASVRIPAAVAEKGFGYLEDRRPAANMDPYRVCTAMLESTCGNGFDSNVFRYFIKA